MRNILQIARENSIESHPMREKWASDIPIEIRAKTIRNAREILRISVQIVRSRRSKWVRDRIRSVRNPREILRIFSDSENILQIVRNIFRRNSENILQIVRNRRSEWVRDGVRNGCESHPIRAKYVRNRYAKRSIRAKSERNSENIFGLWKYFANREKYFPEKF